MLKKVSEILAILDLPEEIRSLISNAKSCHYASDRATLFDLAMGQSALDEFKVFYDVNGLPVHEATVTRCKNGLAVNYVDPYMRRRDPDCMLIGDARPTDKPRYSEIYNQSFEGLRNESLEWLTGQDLVLTAFTLGALPMEMGYGGLLIAPANAGFFIGGLADLQGIIDLNTVKGKFPVHTTVFLAPPFRHTHFSGKQVVVHNRKDDMYEIFSYNLYPGPSAKKGIYGSLLSIGEDEHWPTLHASTVQVVTPYDNVTTIMHEGASGSGKSEMLEYVHRQEDGRLLLGHNLNTQERRYLSLPRTCELRPVTDDMAMCMKSEEQKKAGYVNACDAEQAWFVRLDHIRKYGTDPHLEKTTIHPGEPLIFINIQGVPGSTCLIWEHIEDQPSVPCPNPRVILPRWLVPGTVNGFVEVHVRNFGIRTPPCSKAKPSYGIVGLLHLLPPSLAWLWRLVSPRGYDNPSITKNDQLSSEGVGSYWPFASGRLVDHANLLLRQIMDTPKTRYTLTPNQHIGAWKVSFMPQWISREYMARRGIAQFTPDQLMGSRCPLLGYTLKSMQVEGSVIPTDFLRVHEQPEIGEEGFEAGAAILNDFFKKELVKYLSKELHPDGRKIIECCLDDGKISDYEALIGHPDGSINN